MNSTIDRRSMLAIANNAVRKAQRESLANGVANVYTKNKVIYFQLPDGTITMENPYTEQLKKLRESATKQ